MRSADGMRVRTPSQFRVDLSVAAGNAREFELWRDGLRPLFTMDALDATSRSSFAIEATSYQFSDVAIVSGRSSAALFQRDPLTIARGGLDHICLVIHTEGGCALDVEGRSAEAHPGDVCFLDMSRLVTLRAPNYASLTLLLPRATLQPYVADLDALHGRILPFHREVPLVPGGVQGADDAFPVQLPPARRAATAWLKPLPPSKVAKRRPATVSPAWGKRAALTTRSIFKLPTTTIFFILIFILIMNLDS